MRSIISIALSFISASLAGYAATHGHPAALYVLSFALVVTAFVIIVRARDARFRSRIRSICEEPAAGPRAVAAVSTPPEEPLPAKPGPRSKIAAPPPIPPEALAPGPSGSKDPEPSDLVAPPPVDRRDAIPPPPPDVTGERPALRLVYSDGKRLELRNRPKKAC